MISYRQAKALSTFFISGATDPAFDGNYKRYGPANGPSASFYHNDWPDGAPHKAHFTIALQGRGADTRFEHFHISVECDGTNVGIYYNYNAARGNLAKAINYGHVSPNIRRAFNDFYSVETNWRSIDVMALQGFSKISGILVSTVFHTEYRASEFYANIKTEVDEDLSLAFAQLFQH